MARSAAYLLLTAIQAMAIAADFASIIFGRRGLNHFFTFTFSGLECFRRACAGQSSRISLETVRTQGAERFNTWSSRAISRRQHPVRFRGPRPAVIRWHRANQTRRGNCRLNSGGTRAIFRIRVQLGGSQPSAPLLNGGTDESARAPHRTVVISHDHNHRDAVTQSHP